MNRKDSERDTSQKISELPEISVEESANGYAAEVVVAMLPKTASQDKNIESDDKSAKNDCETDTSKRGDLENGNNSFPSLKPSYESQATGCDDTDKELARVGSKKIIMDNGDDDGSGNSDVILVDELNTKGASAAITRSKAKSVGQVDYAAGLRRRQAISPKNFRKAMSEEGKLNEVQAEDLEKRLKALAAAFSARTLRTKKKIQQPPTPSSGESESEEAKLGEPTLLERLRQLASPDPSEFGDSRRKSLTEKVRGTFIKNFSYISNVVSCNYILDPQSSICVGWLLVVGIVFLYNTWVIPLRVVFPYQTESNVKAWIVSDCIADLVYLIDLLAFKPHVKFIRHGFWVKEPKETMWSYLKTIQFKLDVIALFPVDLVVVIFLRKNMPLLRLTRYLKIQTFWELFRQLDTYLANPHRARVFHTCLYMLYMIHMVACSYYALSTWEGIGTTTWTFDGHGNAYVRCFYFATKTATSIGKNPKPENELEYVFMTFAWLSGVFVFAILIGQIRDIIATATKSQTEYRILTSATVDYLHRLGVPAKLQDRVKLWLSYTWEQQKTLDETKILNLLPKNMKAEIALNIHVETLAKVKLFQNCETAFLRDLVVKLRSIIILPGDFVCRKGEIGREMFIVKSGKIQVIGGPSGNTVLATLGEGSVFGEIALLGIGGMNKRTADVRAGGFSNVFVLNKADLNDVIRDYPEAQDIMQKKAKRLMRESIKKMRASSPSPATTSDDCVSLPDESGVIIKNKSEPPQLISTILKLFPPTTKIGRYLTQGSKLSSNTDLSEKGSSATSYKPDDPYTSVFTSYPPSPFIPTSPGHISPELDISIMTRDSSEEMLSPPPGSRQDSSEMTISSENDYRSDEFEEEGVMEKTEERLSSEQEIKDTNSDVVQRKTRSVELRNEHHRNSDMLLLPACNDKPQERCPSPLPPLSRKNDIYKRGRPRSRRASFLPRDALLASLSTAELDEKLLVTVKGRFAEPRKSCPHFDTATTNREEIPIENRPPLYIIEPSAFYFEERNELSLLRRKKMLEKITGSSGSTSIAITDSSLEEDMQKEFGAEKEDSVATPSSSKMVVGDGKEVDNAFRNVKGATSSSSRSGLIATQFISSLRRPLQRQPEVDMEMQRGSSKVKSVVSGKEAEESGTTSDNAKPSSSTYSLDLDSD